MRDGASACRLPRYAHAGVRRHGAAAARRAGMWLRGGRGCASPTVAARHAGPTAAARRAGRWRQLGPPARRRRGAKARRAGSSSSCASSSRSSEETDERAGAHVARGKARAARRPVACAVVHGTPANFRKLLDGQLKKLVAVGNLTRVKNSFKLAAAGRELAVGEFFSLFFLFFRNRYACEIV
ncbi:hypothetical protein PVAP13_4KG310300 [Panicum virgatum]|uniref:Uncharacterized protein n=1 Tax=Panicum virgatum TaxID=38727 RepID=A0A8T0TVV5_PANVG|nr:hypothetical protein PVAP13_4KG310300 [Panicum virgatum]